MINTTASWASIAPTRPADRGQRRRPRVSARRPRRARRTTRTRSHLQVLIDINGTPRWANGGQTPNHMPKKLTDLTTFAKMLATRYNGHHGHGNVTLWSVWNEPNLQLFLTPQFSGNEDRQPRRVRQALQGGVRRHQGRQQGLAGRDRRDVEPGPRQADRHRRAGPVGRARHVRAPPGPDARAEVPGVGDASVPDEAQREAAREGALPERHPRHAADVRDESEEVLPSRGPDLDHRVRLPDRSRSSRSASRTRNRPRMRSRPSRTPAPTRT